MRWTGEQSHHSFGFIKRGRVRYTTRMNRLLLLILLALPLAAHAQSTESELKARLLHQPLYLRQSWGLDKLRFDSAGNIMGKVPLCPFTLAGIEIESLKLKDNRLELTAHRVGLEFVKQVPKRVALEVSDRAGLSTHVEAMELTIDAPADGDYAKVLDAIFAQKLQDLVPDMPMEWQSFAGKYILQLPPSEPAAPANTRKIGGSITPPVVLNAPEPEFNATARALRWSGKVLVYLQVDAAGHVSHLRLLKALGLGLDERALIAVSNYKLKPAMDNGRPVAVEVNVEVNFGIR